MNTVSFPPEYQQVMVYLIIPDPAAFIAFAKDVLGATEKMIGRDEAGTYRHCEMQIGNSVVMFSATMDGFSAQTAGLFAYVADVDAAYQKALSLGATTVMPVSDQPYGRSGGVKDTNGNTWWLTTNSQAAG